MELIKFETKEITLRDTEALEALSKHACKSKRELEIIIITYLLNNRYIEDIKEDSGKTMEEALEPGGGTLEELMHNCIIAEPSKRLETLLGNLQLWNLENDCPECGCEMEYQDIGYEGEYYKCINCGEEINRGGYYDPDEGRDDCN